MPDRDRDLRDERSLRLELEARLASEVERTATWRKRAEDRSERIARLEGELAKARRPLSRLRALVSPVTPAPVATPPIGAERHDPCRALLPVVKVVAAVGTANQPIADEATTVEPTPANVAAADLVLLDRAGWDGLTSDTRRIITESASLPAPVPFVYLPTGPQDSPPSDLPGVRVVQVAPTFPAVWGRPDRRLPPLVVDREAILEPTAELVSAASRGRPVIIARPDATVVGGDADPARASAAARRWAARLHAPWVRLSLILDVAGVPTRPALPTLAAILVSNRADRVAGALTALAHQTRRPDEVVVGLHGIAPEGIEDACEAMPFPVRLERFSGDITLGEALNRSISRTGAMLISKVDDDDHYGPGFYEDAVHDLALSTAGVVGKAAMFMYRGDNDTMVLRRIDQDDTVIGGTMPGGSLVMHRRVWDRVGFPHRPRFVDALLLDGARRMGEVTVSGNRFEFCLVRHGVEHTFAASADRFTAGAETVMTGYAPEIVEVPDLLGP